MTLSTLLARLTHTNVQNTALLVQRVVLGLVILPHGAQKLLGWFGGYGFGGTMGFFTHTLHVPAPLALLVIVGESLGALALIAGVGTRIAAVGITAIMVGAVAITHAQFGFFMNWFGAQQGEGFEFHLLALALSVPLMLWGGGSYAVDSAVQARIAPTPAP